jgi:hypothetical protein
MTTSQVLCLDKVHLLNRLHAAIIEAAYGIVKNRTLMAAIRMGSILTEAGGAVAAAVVKARSCPPVPVEGLNLNR